MSSNAETRAPWEGWHVTRGPRWHVPSVPLPGSPQAQKLIRHHLNCGLIEGQTHVNEAQESDSCFGMPIYSPVMEAVPAESVGLLSAFASNFSLPPGRLYRVDSELGIRALGVNHALLVYWNRAKEA